MSNEEIKMIIERLKNNAIIKRYCVCCKADDLISEECLGLEYYKDRYRNDFSEVEEDDLRETDERYIELLEELDELDQAICEIRCSINYIVSSWQFERLKRELISILDKYDLWENSELADIIETLGIKKGDGEREDIVVEDSIEKIMENFDEYAQSLLGGICIEEAEEPSIDPKINIEKYDPVYELVKKFMRQAGELYEKGIGTIDSFELIQKIATELKRVRSLKEAKSVQREENINKGEVNREDG